MPAVRWAAARCASEPRPGSAACEQLKSQPASRRPVYVDEQFAPLIRLPELFDSSTVSPIASEFRTAHGTSTATRTATATAASATRRPTAAFVHHATTGTSTTATRRPSLRV